MTGEDVGTHEDCRDVGGCGPDCPWCAYPEPPVPRSDFDALLAVATIYVSAFSDDEMMTLPEKLRLQEVEAILERHGRRY